MIAEFAASPLTWAWNLPTMSNALLLVCLTITRPALAPRSSKKPFPNARVLIPGFRFPPRRASSRLSTSRCACWPNPSASRVAYELRPTVLRVVIFAAALSDWPILGPALAAPVSAAALISLLVGGLVKALDAARPIAPRAALTPGTLVRTAPAAGTATSPPAAVTRDRSEVLESLSRSRRLVSGGRRRGRRRRQQRTR